MDEGFLGEARDADQPPADGAELPVGLKVAFMEIPLSGMPFEVVTDPATGQRHIVIGPALTRFTIPLDREAALSLAKQLEEGANPRSQLVIAQPTPALNREMRRDAERQQRRQGR